MQSMETLWDRARHWLEPFVYLSNNLLSLLGLVTVTTAAVFWLFLLPTTLRHEVDNPYIGILTFMLLPGAFFAGLALIPLGIVLSRRRQRRAGALPAVLPPLDFHNVKLRRLVVLLCLATVANIIIASQLTYGAVEYMDGVTFCGRTCHTVMEPEYAAYQESPHSRVECVKCHIGPGASWFVKSKLSGVWQVFAVTFNTYDRPIPTPVRNLRPARETCEVCHWPQKFGEDRLRIIRKYAEDEVNTMSRTVLLMRIGGGRMGRVGIHGVHLGEGVTIRYAHVDEKRQTIPWVEATRSGRTTTYLAPDAPPDAARKFPVRVMDCMDCHNRPSHSFELPERAVDRALASGAVSAALLSVKKMSVELLKKPYPSHAQAERDILGRFDEFYRGKAPAADVQHSARAVLAIYKRNVFPAMKLTWGVYPNNIGHTDYPGCFRCHDDQHVSGDKKIGQDCNACHQLLAMEEAAPKILADLGLETQ